ncbi:hypothetical protein BZZ01_09470 [Nostocales cyanobacterium HT-58-2]|nr:hypothetical protein BZZ01_09470 [Nostocales cyanobacterium HT-58-2]
MIFEKPSWLKSYRTGFWFLLFLARLKSDSHRQQSGIAESRDDFASDKISSPTSPAYSIHPTILQRQQSIL